MPTFLLKFPKQMNETFYLVYVNYYMVYYHQNDVEPLKIAACTHLGVLPCMILFFFFYDSILEPQNEKI